MKIKSLITVLLLAAIPVLLFLFDVEMKKPEVGGIQTTATDTKYESQENQTARSEFAVDDILVDIARNVGQNVVEVMDANFVWQTQKADYEILGKGVVFQNISEKDTEKVFGRIKGLTFIQDSENTKNLPNANYYGFALEDLVCIAAKQNIRDYSNYNSFATDLELRCGFVDYARTRN